MSNLHFQYPSIRRSDKVVDKYFGKSISDPYRWLENPYSDETKEFKALQNNLTNSYLEQCPLRDTIRERLKEICRFSQRSCPTKRWNRYYYYQSTGLQNQSVLFAEDAQKRDPIKILDPNELAPDGSLSINIYTVSPDGNLLAYGLSKNGCDWINMYFKDLNKNDFREDVLSKVKFTFSLGWTPDSNGIFYSSFPNYIGPLDGVNVTKNEHQKLYYHRIGTKQNKDILVGEFPRNPSWKIGSIVSECGNYLLMTVRQGVRDNLVYYAKLESGLKTNLDLNFKPLVTRYEADFTYITNDAQRFYFCTNKDAPNYQIILIDIATGRRSTAIKEASEDVIDWAKCVNGNQILICYLRHMKHILQLRNLYDGSILREFEVDLGKSITKSYVDRNSSEFFVTIDSFVSPSQVYRVNLSDQTPQLRVYYENSVKTFDPSLFITKQLFYSSKDLTRIPMFITHKKNVTPNKNSPCYLHAYGGYGTCVRANFVPFNIAFMENLNGIVAVAHIRGGGEYGSRWHNGGRLLQKQNGFTDFQEAAKYLIANKMTSPDKLTIHGMSNGGLLIGACINQRPDLYRAAIAEVGIMDMLRFHKFTVGNFWCNEFGCPDWSPYFESLLKISPLHNVRNRQGIQYPAVLLLASENDDRVVPSHSFKFIAELQYKLGQRTQQTNPLMIRIQDKAGHEAGKPLSKVIEEQTDVMAYIIRALELKYIT